MQAAGFAPEDYDQDPFEVWPENWFAWQLFAQVSTQWRIGVSGPVGLDYGPLFTLMDRQGLQGHDWQNTFDDIRVIEVSALDQIKAQSNG